MNIAKGSSEGVGCCCFLDEGGGNSPPRGRLTGEVILLILEVSLGLARLVLPPRFIFIVWPDYRKRRGSFLFHKIQIFFNFQNYPLSTINTKAHASPHF